MRPAADEHASKTAAAGDSELGGFVAFCVSQLEAAMKEAFHDLNELSDTVLDADRALGLILQEPASGRPATKSLEAVRDGLRRAGVHLQSLDRLQQRLDNACRNLLRAGTLMNGADLPIQHQEWQEFLRKARRSYTMEDERRMFDWRYERTDAVNEDSPDGGGASDPVLF